MSEEMKASKRGRPTIEQTVREDYDGFGFSEETFKALIFLREVQWGTLDAKDVDIVKLSLAKALKAAADQNIRHRQEMQEYALKAATAAQALQKAEADIETLTKAFYR